MQRVDFDFHEHSVMVPHGWSRVAIEKMEIPKYELEVVVHRNGQRDTTPTIPQTA